MTPLELACRACAQQPNEPCTDMPDGEFHPERIEDAAYWSGDRDDSTRAKTMDAVETVVLDELF